MIWPVIVALIMGLLSILSSQRHDRSRLFDVIGTIVCVGAAVWQGWAGLLIYLAAGIVTGAGTIYNDRRAARRGR